MAQKKRSIFQSAPVPAGPAAAAPVEALVLAEDAATALKQLAKHRLRAPGDAQGYVLAAALQRDAGLAADAEVLLAAGMKKAQAAPGVAGAYAAAALLRGDRTEAIRRAERARSLAPEEAAGYAVGIAGLLGEGKAGEAEALMGGALRLPGGLAALSAAIGPLLSGQAATEGWTGLLAAASRPAEADLRNRGFGAAAAGDWAGAAAVWAEMRIHYPGSTVGWVHGAFALSELGEGEAADALLAEAETRLNGHLSVLVAAGYVAMKRQNWPLSEQRWARVRAMAPATQDAWVHGIASLRQAGDIAAADALQAEALRALPDNLAVLSQYAYDALDREDWDAALVRWRVIAATFPENNAAAVNIAELLERTRGG